MPVHGGRWRPSLRAVVLLLALCAAISSSGSSSNSSSSTGSTRGPCNWAELHAQFARTLAAATAFATLRYNITRHPPFPSPCLNGTSLAGPAAACVRRRSMTHAVLIMGDSIDRIMVGGGCAHWNITAYESGAGVNGTREGRAYAYDWEWSRGRLKHNSGGLVSSMCVVERLGSNVTGAAWLAAHGMGATNVSAGSSSNSSKPGSGHISSVASALFGFVHILGAEPQGPYLFGLANSAEDGYIDTASRVPYVSGLFEQALGVVPSLVIYRADMWSFYKQMADRGWNSTLVTATRWEPIIDKFIEHTNATLAWLRARYPPSTLVGVHTVPMITNEGATHALYTAGLRAAARRLGLPVWDWAEITAPRPPSEYLTDGIHPAKHPSAWFASFVLSSAKAWDAMRCQCEQGSH
mmetsp:Transcript_29412/g.75027  ORF Transcript_29412/g.75027 Transcript_29412/m.75027 type:complete len:409 (-) Transcript_29412:347-1573(-)|eukprot:CAMPEP_0202887134 /NCGR_PEP_ID=MMETSP1391-20130828/42524_1 /ASSEMBLY_ACC=CAM_ASM_000867 /TAXON_ID=1034604 /ORGANISM="Chlamydomonas leiostraca, Strain SAG 11-49" /LENGTH=408 /DNA_ID=CAMNT_0049570411 /DNA_START=250 /DNA_END=1476 /DNA_ORIENTATION=+